MSCGLEPPPVLSPYDSEGKDRFITEWEQWFQAVQQQFCLFKEGVTNGHIIEDERVVLPQRKFLNFTGIGVAATDNVGLNTTDVTIPAPGSVMGHIIQDEGVDLPQEVRLNFVGAGVTATDNPGVATVVTIPGATGNGSSWVFGGGTDGVVHFDGTNTFAAFATKSGSVYTLIRSVWGTTVTVDNGVTVNANSWQVRATVALVVNGNLNADGRPGVNNIGGTSIASLYNAVYLNGSTAGNGSNSVSTPGSNGTNAGLYAIGGKGGDGGAGASSAGGAAGTIQRPPNQVGGLGLASDLISMLLGKMFLGSAVNFFCGGSGGGGGGVKNPASGANGGGGGSGADILGIFAKAISGSGTITAKGGDGFPGNGATPGGGGGGGGGGGALLIASESLVASYSAMLSVAGGLGGTVAGGAFVAGADGAAGTIVTVQL